MKFWILTFSFLSALFISGCQFGATPPVAGPNIDNNDNIPDSAPDFAGDGDLYSNTDHITITTPSSSPSNGDNTTGNGDPSPVMSPPLPDAILSSDEGVFNPNQVVLVGVELATDFSGVPPLVGPVDLSDGSVPATLALVKVTEKGSIEFGVYTDLETKPGTYIFFASQGNISLTIPLTIIVE